MIKTFSADSWQLARQINEKTNKQTNKPKKTCRGIQQVREAGREKDKAVSLLENDFIRKNTRAVSVRSQTNVPVRFRAQQRAKYKLLELTANCIATKRCRRHFTN